MSYNILNKNVNFQGDTSGSIENMVDTHSSQSITGSKDFLSLSASVGRVANDLTVLGNVSASVNISASFFYGDGSTLDNVGNISFDGSTANGVLTFKDADEATVESNLTFDGSTLDFKGSSISGSGNISGSAFYGAGTGLSSVPGSAVGLASGGGLADSSGLTLSTSGVTAQNSPGGSSKVWIDESGVKYATITNILSNNAAVTAYGTQGASKVLIGAGGTEIAGAGNLNFFGGNSLAITGALSASTNLQIGGTVRLDGVAAASPAIGADSVYFLDADDSITKKVTFANFAAAMAGDGLNGTGGDFDINVSGALKIASDKLGISGSFAGIGLSYSGSVDAVGGVALDLSELTDANMTLANDHITFLKNSDSTTKREQWADVVSNMAGTGLTATNGTLSVSGEAITATTVSASSTLQAGSIETSGSLLAHGSISGMVLSNNTIISNVLTVPANNNSILYGPITVSANGSFTIADTAKVKIKDFDDV